jgi:hypothetical protein
MLNREKGACETRSVSAMLPVTAQKIARFSIAGRRIRKPDTMVRDRLCIRNRPQREAKNAVFNFDDRIEFTVGFAGG